MNNVFTTYGSLEWMTPLVSKQFPRTDNAVFWLHYRVTTVMLIFFVLFISSLLFFSEQIICTDRSKWDWGVTAIEYYCLMHHTFSVPEAQSSAKGGPVPYPGIGSSFNRSRVHHKYYQWVFMVLFIQSGFFYLPHFLWKCWEGKRLNQVVHDLNETMLPVQNQKKQVWELIKYCHWNRGHHNMYFIKYVTCEVLNFLNVILQIYLTNLFLGGAFFKYGFEVYKYYWYYGQQNNRVNPMETSFPFIAKCFFSRFGPGGDLKTEDNICLLNLNVINSRIYLVLWFWFFALAVLSGLVLIYRLLLACSATLRHWVIQLRFFGGDASAHHLSVVLQDCKRGDWFFLYRLAKNMEEENYSIFIERYSKYLTKCHDRDLLNR